MKFIYHHSFPLHIPPYTHTYPSTHTLQCLSTMKALCSINSPCYAALSDEPLLGHKGVELKIFY